MQMLNDCHALLSALSIEIRRMKMEHNSLVELCIQNSCIKLEFLNSEYLIVIHLQININFVI